MAEDFDPYYKWLGIPPAEQPPNHYCLLGLRVFEADPDVIEHAADRQMSHVRNFQNGKYSDHSQQLLNEISQVKIVLLNEGKKKSYDARLMTTNATAEAPAKAPPLRTYGAARRAAPAGPGPAQPSGAFRFSSASASSQVAARRRASRWQSVMMFLGAMAAVLFVGGVFLVIGWGEKESKKPKPARSTAEGATARQEKPQEVEKVNVDAVETTDEPPQVEPPVVPERLAFSFDNQQFAARYWDWNDKWTFEKDGGHAPRGPQSFLRSKHEFIGELSIDMEFSFGQAKFSNTGGCWITLWNQKLLISNHWGRMDAKVAIRRDGDELVYDLNGEQTRVVIQPDDVSKPTKIEVRWRSRISHFRHIEIKADEKL